MEGQEFLLGFRFQFLFLRLLLGKDVFLFKAVLQIRPYLFGVQLVKIPDMAY